MSAPFVGRQRELDTLVALSGRARAEHGPAMAIVTGPPGSGKTRLLNEAFERARDIRRVRVAGYEPMQPVPLAALGDLLRQLTTAPRDGANLEALVFGGQDQSAPDPLRMFETAHRALSMFVPMLVAIDDLQWVDEQSLALVHYLLRAAGPDHQALVVIAVARPSAAAATFGVGIEAGLPTERQVRLDLGPLPLEDGLTLARAIDGSMDEANAAALWRRAGGSPFWLEALARGSDSLDRSSVIDDRLRTLSGDAGELIAALAVAARPFPGIDVAHALEWDVERVHHAARELVTRGLALEIVGGFRLAHDLIRDAVTHAIPAATVRRLHATLAEVIGAEAGNDVQLLREALGHRAAAGLPTATLASRLLASPQRRLIGGEGLHQIASISDRLEAGSSEQLELDVGIGELAAVLGDQELAIDRWTRVSDRSADATARVRAALEAARAAYLLARSADAHRHLRRARSSVPPWSAVAVELDALEAEIELWLDHETAAGCRTAARALATAEAMAAAVGGVERLPTTERRAYLAALEAASDGALQEDRGDDVIRLSEVTALVAREFDQEAYVAALMRPGFALRPLGRIREAQALYRLAWDVSSREVMPTAMVEAGHGLARGLRDLGRLAEAREIALETVALEIRLGHPPGRWGNAPSIVHTIDLALGDPTAALRALRLDAAAERDPHYRQAVHQAIAAWMARFSGARQASDVAAELAAARADSALARCPRCSAELSVVSVELLARIGRPEEAERGLEAWAGAQVGTTYPMRDLWRQRAQAAIAMARGEAPKAASILATSIAWLQDTGLVDDLLWARIDHGRALEVFERDLAIEAFAEAARLAESIGAVSQRRLTSQALRRLGVRAWRRGRTSTGDGLSGLSEREREVAELVAKGGSNREIADLLLLSPKTVERHLTNILAKLDLRNRTALAGLVRSSQVRGSADE
jgi:DNA-binding CsgD family transcriptional regulator